METRVHLPDMEPPSSITEVMVALRSKKLEPVHAKKSCGDWIPFPGKQTAISIESMRGLASSATVEYSEDDDIEINQRILAAFGKLGWMGSDEDGEFRLD